MGYRLNMYDITPLMGDVLVILAGTVTPMTAKEIKAQMEIKSPQHIGKVLAGLKLRGHIAEAQPRWQDGAQSRTWKFRHEGVSDQFWGRVMVDHARRHGYPLRDALTDDDLERYEVRVA